MASRGKTPFSANGRNLNTRFEYDLAGPSYRGDLSVQPIVMQLGSYRPLPVGIATSLVIENNRITREVGARDLGRIEYCALRRA